MTETAIRRTVEIVNERGLHARAGRRRGREIGCHHRRGAPQEGEGPGLHARVAQGQQVGQARLALFDQDLDGVASMGGRLSIGVVLARASPPQVASQRDALLRGKGVRLTRQGPRRQLDHQKFMA